MALGPQTHFEIKMTFISRRDALKAALLGAVSLQTAPYSPAQVTPPISTVTLRPARGLEGQRQADLGDGTVYRGV